ncbi:MAG: TatD family hydrolase [Acidobacteriota bacterium]|nr:MAG: TatD family hydrolase [Acidobacteriota bacterium]
MRLIDSHCHIDGPRFDEDRDEVVRRALEAGVKAMLNVGTGSPSEDSFEKTRALTEAYDCVYGSAGIHPHDASEYSEEVEERIRKVIRSSAKMIAWGEIGLDYYYDHSPRDVQRDAFRRQIRAAREEELPIIIHSRDANEDTVAILTEECSYEDFRGGIMHCFGGTAEMAEALMPLGFLISFAGNVTFKNAGDLRDAARVVPRESLLVETDCPYLTPVPHRGKRNEPCFVADTARFLADFYGESPDILAERTTQNFCGFFGVEI